MKKAFLAELGVVTFEETGKHFGHNKWEIFSEISKLLINGLDFSL